jgi:hypothetical protein
MFILILNVFFTTQILKVAPIRMRFSPGFPPGAGFHGEEFAQACFYNPEELLSVVHFPRRLLQRGSQSGEDAPAYFYTDRKGVRNSVIYML